MSILGSLIWIIKFQISKMNFLTLLLEDTLMEMAV